MLLKRCQRLFCLNCRQNFSILLLYCRACHCVRAFFPSAISRSNTRRDFLPFARKRRRYEWQKPSIYYQGYCGKWFFSQRCGHFLSFHEKPQDMILTWKFSATFFPFLWKKRPKTSGHMKRCPFSEEKIRLPLLFVCSFLV